MLKQENIHPLRARPPYQTRRWLSTSYFFKCSGLKIHPQNLQCTQCTAPPRTGNSLAGLHEPPNSIVFYYTRQLTWSRKQSSRIFFSRWLCAAKVYCTGFMFEFRLCFSWGRCTLLDWEPSHQFRASTFPAGHNRLGKLTPTIKFTHPPIVLEKHWASINPTPDTPFLCAPALCLVELFPLLL